MTHIPDGTPYPFLPQDRPTACVGWLDGSHDYLRGTVPADFVVKLARLCRSTTLRTRGWHYCNLCVADRDRHLAADCVKSVVLSDDGEFAVGSAEVHLGVDGAVMFVAPDMVIHYVTDHGYRPPEAFIEAVLATG